MSGHLLGTSVFALEAAGYASPLVKVKTYGGREGTCGVILDGGSARFRAADSRDHLVTRYQLLAPGRYELRVRWPSGSDATRVLVRAQLRDFSWISAVTTERRDEAGLTIVSSFEISESQHVRLLIIAGDGARLPDCIELVDAGEQPFQNGEPSGTDEAALDRALLWIAAMADKRAGAPILASLSEDRIDRVLAHDSWLRNYVKNAWEFLHARPVLSSYPIDVCIPIADVCNARCTFCTSWLEGTRVATLEEIDRFEDILRMAGRVGLAGHGEPLAHPRIRDILARLADWLDPRAWAYVVTNGVYLPDLLEELTRSRVTRFAISLNAATPATHQEVMGLPGGAFDAIIDTIQTIVAGGGPQASRVSISMVVTRQNIDEVPAFVALANRLGVSRIQLKTLAPVGALIEGLNFQLLPPYEHPDYARLKSNALAAIESSAVPVQADPASWDVPVFPAAVQERLRSQFVPVVTREEALRDRELRRTWRTQPKYAERPRGRVLEDLDDFDGVNPFARRAPFACRAPYRYLYINDFSFNLSPCCYLPHVPGAEPAIFGGAGTFQQAWNSEAMVALRRRLQEGPLFNMCTKCPGTY